MAKRRAVVKVADVEFDDEGHPFVTCEQSPACDGSGEGEEEAPPEGSGGADDELVADILACLQEQEGSEDEMEEDEPEW